MKNEDAWKLEHEGIREAYKQYAEKHNLTTTNTANKGRLSRFKQAFLRRTDK